MEQNKNLGIVIEPVIDSQNPPISIDTVLLGENPSGSVRLVGFSGNLFPIKEDTISVNGNSTQRIWVRPVCVADIGLEAVRFLEGYLLQKISSNSNELEFAEKYFPEAIKKLQEIFNKNN